MTPFQGEGGEAALRRRLGGWPGRPQDVVRVHQAATEVEALAVEQALRSAGIRAWLRSRQVPGYAQALATATGVWGDVLVAAEDAAVARQVVADYLGAVRQGARGPRVADAREPAEERDDAQMRQQEETAVPQERQAQDATGAQEQPTVRQVRRIHGIIPPLVTLFDAHGRVDEEAMRRHVDRLIAAGVHGLFALGTTGEVMHLTPEERRRVAELVVRQAAGRVPVLIGCGGTATDEVVAYARHAEAVGADAVVVIVPYYWTLGDRNVEAHYTAVARAVRVPVIIYNFPAVSGRNLPAPLVARLAEAAPGIAGIKETLDSIGHIQQVLAHVRPVRPDFAVLCGYEYHLLNTLVLGGDGAIPGMANVFPEPAVRLYDAFRAGDLATAAALARERLDFPALYQLDAPLFVVVKEAMALAGVIEHPVVRLPALPLEAESRRRLRRLLAAFGLLEGEVAGASKGNATGVWKGARP